MTRKDYILLMAKSGMLGLMPYQNLFAKDHKIKSWTSEESFLNSKEGILISTLAETIIPEADSIGAIEAGVPHFIDMYVQNCYDKEGQDTFFKQLQGYKTYLEEKAIAYDVPNTALTDRFIVDESGDNESFKEFLKKTKIMVLKGYFTTEKALKQNQNYDPIPGNYMEYAGFSEGHGCWAN